MQNVRTQRFLRSYNNVFLWIHWFNNNKLTEGTYVHNYVRVLCVVCCDEDYIISLFGDKIIDAVINDVWAHWLIHKIKNWWNLTWLKYYKMRMLFRFNSTFRASMNVINNAQTQNHTYTYVTHIDFRRHIILSLIDTALVNL